MKTKKTKKKQAQSNHFKKISNKTFSDWMQHLIDNFDIEWLDSHTNREVMILPMGLQTYFADYLQEFGSYVRMNGIDLTTVSCKKMHGEISNFTKTEYKNFSKSKKDIDTIFFAYSYSLATLCLTDRSVRKLVGVKKGFFG